LTSRLEAIYINLKQLLKLKNTRDRKYINEIKKEIKKEVDKLKKEFDSYIKKLEKFIESIKIS